MGCIRKYFRNNFDKVRILHSKYGIIVVVVVVVFCNPNNKIYSIVVSIYARVDLMGISIVNEIHSQNMTSFQVESLKLSSVRHTIFKLNFKT